MFDYRIIVTRVAYTHKHNNNMYNNYILLLCTNLRKIFCRIIANVFRARYNILYDINILYII